MQELRSGRNDIYQGEMKSTPGAPAVEPQREPYLGGLGLIGFIGFVGFWGLGLRALGS